MKSSPDLEIIRLLKARADRPLSGEDISRKLGISRSAVWKHIELLRSLGYIISALPHEGYRLTASPDRMYSEEIQSELETRWMGRHILCFESLDSTNRALLEMAEKSAPAGTVVVAETQTAGRGRMGRSWSSPKGMGIYASVLLRPRMGIRDLSRITLVAGIAITDVLNGQLKLDAQIRWPNDILINDKKLSGILTEMNAEVDRVSCVIVGIGLNVRATPKPLTPQATSLEKETDRIHPRPLLLARILEAFEKRYESWEAGKVKNLIKAWEDRSYVTGRSVEINSGGRLWTGTAKGIDEDGALWIRTRGGLDQRFLSGDVTLLRTR